MRFNTDRVVSLSIPGRLVSAGEGVLMLGTEGEAAALTTRSHTS